MYIVNSDQTEKLFVCNLWQSSDLLYDKMYKHLKIQNNTRHQGIHNDPKKYQILVSMVSVEMLGTFTINHKKGKCGESGISSKYEWDPYQVHREVAQIRYLGEIVGNYSTNQRPVKLSTSSAASNKKFVKTKRFPCQRCL